jgi:hypothetical protein
VIPARPAGWAHIICGPGNSPFVSLAQAIAPELTGDTDAIGLMVRFEEPDVAVELISRWRQRHEYALVVVDQFEELFTQNSSDIQARFAGLMGRLAVEADVHVLLSMRDDFLMRCNDHRSLAPIFSELTPLRPLTGPALRRALVQPAMTCGYRFEDDELVDEMIAEVEGERGALPLVAFAAARLWEQRDRDQGLLTRQAYRDMGGVGGALARHAEAARSASGTSCSQCSTQVTSKGRA